MRRSLLVASLWLFVVAVSNAAAEEPLPGVARVSLTEFLEAEAKSAGLEFDAEGHAIHPHGSYPQTPHYFLVGEFLGLKPRQRQLDFALQVRQGSAVPVGPVQSLSYEFRPGFRVGGGVSWGDDWDARILYTNFYSKDRQLIDTRNTNQQLYPTALRPSFIELVENADANAVLQINAIDLELGKRLHLGEGMDLRLFSGPRFTWYQQQMTVNYSGGDANQTFTFQRQETDAVGLRVGADWDCHLFWNFSFFTRCSGAVLVGEFKTDVVETTDAGFTTLTNWRDGHRRAFSTADLSIGIGYTNHHLHARVGYVFSQVFGFYDAQDFVSDQSFGSTVRRTADLGLDGLLVELRFDF